MTTARPKQKTATSNSLGMLWSSVCNYLYTLFTELLLLWGLQASSNKRSLTCVNQPTSMCSVT